MNVHLIPAHDLNDELYARVLSLLQAVPGVNKFIPSGEGRIKLPEDILEDQELPNPKRFEKQQMPQKSAARTWIFPNLRGAVQWKDLFQEIQDYRDRNTIPDKQFAILLTPTANKKNWFATLDEERPYNGFIHTDEWEHYITCDPAIPIAFEVIALILQKNIFDNFEQVRSLTHERAIGCISDLCLKKSDIILKMRTADICPHCMERVQRQLSMPEIHHALSLLESLRVKMLYAQNFRQNSPPSKLEVRRGGRIFLTDYGNVEIRMPTLEKALYILFLRYPDGLFLSSLADHRTELYTIYGQISTRGMQKDMDRRIDEMTNILREQLSIKISRIKKAFTDAIGQTLADQYIIQGENAARKLIRLDRQFVDSQIR